MDFRLRTPRLISTLFLVLISTSRLALAGEVSVDLGLAPDRELTGLRLFFARSDERQAELDSLLASQQDPASPLYHRWLTPEMYAARFGASDGEINTVVAWLESQGLKVFSLARGRDSIMFQGRLRQVEAAFATTIRRYRVGDTLHFSSAVAPRIPPELRGKVASISGLHDFYPVTPQFTEPGGDSASLAPGDLAVQYNLKPLYDQHIDGTGQKIVIPGQSRVRASDLQLFRATYNLPAGQLQQILVPGTVDPVISNGQPEAAPYVEEVVASVARNSTLIHVYAPNILDAVFYAIDQGLGSVITTNFSVCEQEASSAFVQQLRGYAQRAAIQGTTWVASSGDNAAAGCTTFPLQDQLAVVLPASLPEVTGVGGTYLFGTVSLLNDANGGSLLSPLKEAGWNSSTPGHPLGTGGGLSVLFPKPLWQVAPGVPLANARAVPDVALTAGWYRTFDDGRQWSAFGNSYASSVFAGMIGLLNHYQLANGLQLGAGMGNVNPRLYAMASVTPNSFRDTLSGNNRVSFFDHILGYTAGFDYDLVTGLGAVDGYNMITNWGSSFSNKADGKIALSASSPSAPQNGTVILTATISASGGGTPTGRIAFFSGAVQLGTSDLTAGAGKSTASLTLALAPFAPGYREFTARYSGDSAYNASTSPEVSVRVTDATGIVVTGAVNAASYAAAAAPGAILAVFGAYLADDAQTASALPLPTSLGGVTVSINGTPAPLYFVSRGQINLQVPYTTAIGTATLRVTWNGQTATSSFAVAKTAPGIFVGFPNRAPVPDQVAKRGQTVTLYITGEGAVLPELVSGTTPPPGVSARPIGVVSVTVGGLPATIRYLGLPSWAIGVTQINYTVPAEVPLGAVPLVVTVGGSATIPVPLTIVP